MYIASATDIKEFMGYVFDPLNEYLYKNTAKKLQKAGLKLFNKCNSESLAISDPNLLIYPENCKLYSPLSFHVIVQEDAYGSVGLCPSAPLFINIREDTFNEDTESRDKLINICILSEQLHKETRLIATFYYNMAFFPVTYEIIKETFPKILVNRIPEFYRKFSEPVEWNSTLQELFKMYLEDNADCLELQSKRVLLNTLT